MKKPVRRRPIVKIQIQDGRFQIMGLGAWHSYWRDPYHLLLTIPWTGFFGIVIAFYLGVNVIFALLYMLQADGIANAAPHSFRDAFFFSIQTLATIGYGAMYPKSTYANTIVTIQALVGIVSTAMMTGLAFARFSRPTARVVFSNVAVIAPFEGKPTLMFRSANQRRNQILEAQMQVYLLRDETTSEGQFIRRFYDLRLVRHRTPSFTLSWTAMHPIDTDSPLFGMTPELLRQMQVSIVASLSGIDETVMQTIHARHNYGAQDILWNHRFVDIFHDAGDGNRYMDFDQFHEAVSLD